MQKSMQRIIASPSKNVIERCEIPQDGVQYASMAKPPLRIKTLTTLDHLVEVAQINPVIYALLVGQRTERGIFNENLSDKALDVDKGKRYTSR